MERLQTNKEDFIATSPDEVRSITSIFKKSITPVWNRTKPASSIDVSILAGCQRMAANYLIGTPIQISEQEAYQEAIGQILNAGSRERLESKLARENFNPSIFYEFPDLRFNGRVDFLYSYPLRDRNSGEVITVDQLVLIRFVPWYIFSDLPADGEEPQREARQELLSTIWSLFTIGEIEGRSLKIMGGNIHYVCSERKKTFKR